MLYQMKRFWKKLEQLEDLEQTDRDGRTLLINAALYDRKSAIEYLLKRNANVNAQDKGGYTALHAAVQEENVEIIKMLLEKGADVHARDVYGNTPLLRTRPVAPKEVFEILLNHDADPKEKNDFGVSLLDAFQADPEIINILTEKKWDNTYNDVKI